MKELDEFFSGGGSFEEEELIKQSRVVGHVPCLASYLALQGRAAEAQRLTKRVRRLNAGKRAALRQVAAQKLPPLPVPAEA
jgi:hypothetical protein